MNDFPSRQSGRTAESWRLQMLVAIATGIDNVTGIETGIENSKEY